MYSLFLDHSFSQEIVSLCEDDHVLQECRLERSFGEHPCNVWQKMLEERDLDLHKIDYFICGTGPGSYTGMRSAAATVQALSFAQKKPIVSVSSLLLLCPPENGEYLLVKDAKIAGFYGQAVHVFEGTISCTNPEILSAEKIVEQHDSGLKVLCEISDSCAHKVKALPVQLHSDAIAQYAFQLFQHNELYSPENLPLSYLRKTQAEMNLSPVATDIISGTAQEGPEIFLK